jgi:hypothetical protein
MDKAQIVPEVCALFDRKRKEAEARALGKDPSKEGEEEFDWGW